MLPRRARLPSAPGREPVPLDYRPVLRCSPGPKHPRASISRMMWFRIGWLAAGFVLGCYVTRHARRRELSAPQAWLIALKIGLVGFALTFVVEGMIYVGRG